MRDPTKADLRAAIADLYDVIDDLIQVIVSQQQLIALQQDALQQATGDLEELIDTTETRLH